MAERQAGKRPDLTQGPIARTLMIFAVPTLASNILQSLNGSINAIWVGRFLGENALAATANANIIMFLSFSAVFGFGMASTVLIGQAMGRRDVGSARRSFGAGLGFCVILAVLVAALGWLFAPAILTGLGTPGDAYGLALTYLRIIFLSLPGTMIGVMMMMGLRGAGDSLTPLWFMIVSVIIDAGLNPVLITGMGPFPEMGIAGSATATALAAYGSMIGLLIYVYARDLPLRLRGRELRYLVPAVEPLRLIVTKGLPMGLQMVVISTSALLMVGLVNREGIIVTAGYGAGQQLWTYLQMPAMAIGAAVSAMAAQNIGAGKWDRVGKITRTGLIANGVMTGAIILLMLTFHRPLLTLFLGSGSPAIEASWKMQTVASWSYWLFGFTLVLFGTMRANGVVLAPLAILAIGLYPGRFLYYYIAYPYQGIDAIWFGFVVGSVVCLILASIAYLRPGWRKVRLAVPPDPEECRESVSVESQPAGRMAPTG